MSQQDDDVQQVLSVVDKLRATVDECWRVALAQTTRNKQAVIVVEQHLIAAFDLAYRELQQWVDGREVITDDELRRVRCLVPSPRRSPDTDPEALADP